MPFVNIHIYKGHSQERKQELARRITEVINEVTEIPKDWIWVVFEDIPPNQWSVGGKLGEGETVAIK